MALIKSSKAKGRRLQNYVRDKLRQLFCETSRVPRLHEDDIKSQTMGMTGEDIVLSPKGREMIPYSFECKNVERLNLWGSLDQCEGNCEGEGIKPVLVIKRNRSKTYAVIEFEEFTNLIGERYGISKMEKR